MLNKVPDENNNPLVTIEAQNKLIKLLMVRLKADASAEDSAKKKEYQTLMDRKIMEISKLVQQQADDIKIEKELLANLSNLE